MSVVDELAGTVHGIHRNTILANFLYIESIESPAPSTNRIERISYTVNYTDSTL